MKERRNFTRIIFSTPAQLSHQGNIWTSSLIDLSLKGALVAKPDNWRSDQVTAVTLKFTLDESDVTIAMDTRVTHEEEGHLGLLCEQIDIDSATHLKRMIELNVGDSDLLNRELEHLSHPVDN